MAKKQSNELFQNFKLAIIVTIVLIVGGVAWQFPLCIFSLKSCAGIMPVLYANTT